MQTQLIWSFSKSCGSPFPLKDLLYTDTHHMGCFQMFCSKHIATKHKYHYIYQWQPLHRDLLHLYILYLTPKQTKFWCDTFVSHKKRTNICVMWIITCTSCVQQIRTIQLQCCVQQRRPLSSNLYFIIISKKETKNISLLQQHTSHSSTWTTLVSHTIGSIHILFKHWKTKQTNKQTNMRSLLHLFLTTILLLLHIQSTMVQAWGKEGHKLVVNIAYSLLSPAAWSLINNILCTISNNDTDFSSPLAKIVNWADEVWVNPQYKWTGHLHYVDVHNDDVEGGCHPSDFSKK